MRQMLLRFPMYNAIQYNSEGSSNYLDPARQCVFFSKELKGFETKPFLFIKTTKNFLIRLKMVLTACLYVFSFPKQMFIL